MHHNNPLVSISLLTYNSQKYINDCLGSIFGQTYNNLEILIIDNASRDKTIDYLKKFPNKPNLRIIFNKKNIGFSAGHNQGIKNSQGNFILCLNHDVALDKDFIKKAIEAFQKDNKIAAIQGKLLRWNTGNPISNNFNDYNISKIIDTSGLVMLKNRRVINREQGQIDKKQFEEVEEIFGADGAAPIYRRKALEDIKINNEYFDEDFFCYNEDVDLAWRLRLYGWKAVYQPNSIALHDRTSGESTVLNYIGIIRERIKIGKFSKYLAFKNKRLMQIKNEQIWLLISHLPWFLSKEILSWAYVLVFERHTWKAIKDLFKQMPNAFRKRKIIMSKKRIDICEMKKWFN